MCEYMYSIVSLGLYMYVLVVVVKSVEEERKNESLYNQERGKEECDE